MPLVTRRRFEAIALDYGGYAVTFGVSHLSLWMAFFRTGKPAGLAPATARDKVARVHAETGTGGGARLAGLRLAAWLRRHGGGG
jgi:hypothetical protein